MDLGKLNREIRECEALKQKFENLQLEIRECEDPILLENLRNHFKELSTKLSKLFRQTDVLTSFPPLRIKIGSKIKF